MTVASAPFEAAAESVGAARRYAVGALDEPAVEHLRDDVRTIVSELATNAVLHARTAFHVSVTVEPAGVRVAVTDGSPVPPRLRRYEDRDATTGRGLRIIDQLTTAWGVEVLATGKTTWCFLALVGGEGAQPGGGSSSTAPDVVPHQQHGSGAGGPA